MQSESAKEESYRPDERGEKSVGTEGKQIDSAPHVATN